MENFVQFGKIEFGKYSLEIRVWRIQFGKICTVRKNTIYRNTIRKIQSDLEIKFLGV